MTRKILPENITPSHYDLHIDSNLEDLTYSGTVTINLHVNSNTENIYINAHKLKITKAQVRINNNILEGIISMEPDEKVKITLKEELVKHTTPILVLEFEGSIADDMNGYYVSKYEENGKQKLLFSTHFEPTAARTVFPCFDEPSMKATFSISLTLPSHLTALSNMSVKHVEEKNNFKTVYFNITPKMSTYLVAFVIGELEFIEKGNNPRIRVYTPLGLKSMGEFALNVAHECIKTFEEYFLIKYPIDKLDMVAIPEFAMGAMENWGLVTYRMSSLLYDPLQSGINTKKLVAETVCHELAHQWFGNLVTMKWWNDLWLNEGFATWAAAMAVDKITMIGWDVFTSFINNDIEVGMRYDGLNSTHPIDVEVNDPNDINQIFDGISYSKGASLIKMLEDYIGEEIFRTGLIKYLKKFQYGNAVTSDLWDCLSEVSGKNIQKLMSDWTTKPGFPLITVKTNNNKLILQQKRFMMDKSEKEGKWFVPIKIKFDGKVKIAEMSEDRIEIQKESENYKLNDGGSGFYRVIYEDNIDYSNIIVSYNDKNKINMINDAFQLALASMISISIPLKIISNMKNETNSEVLFSILNGLTELKSIYYDEFNNLEKKILDYTIHRSIDLQYPGETVDEITLSSLIVNYSVFNNNREMILNLSDIYNDFLKDKNIIHPVFKGALYGAAVKRNENGYFEKVFDVYKKGIVADEKILALRSLGATPDNMFFKTLMEESLKDNIKLQDKITLFVSLINNYEKRDDVIKFVMEHFDELRSSFKDNTTLLSYLIEVVFSVVSKKELLNEVKRFIKGIKIGGLERAISKALEKAEIKTKFRENNDIDSIIEYLHN
ncbi:Aminopeptidase M1 [Astathelohania contejeani]|uniref:Aminopeptidase n=1 Tax=Astathelohania contejeani TaxID=164912 RepID=A0ABQ7HZU8_9MICR|nr:Aminopeptidase M1 [Thelohania contejeani]